MKTGTKIQIGWRGRADLILAITACALSLSACAKFSADGGMSVVADQTGNILGSDALKIRTEEESAAAQARVAGLLTKPLSAESAVQIALLNNRGLQAAYNDLGISEAEMIEASLPPAPTLSLARLTGAELEIERQLVQNVLALLTLPRRREIAEDRFKAAQIRAVDATLRTAVDARRAYYRAVAAAQVVKFLEEARLSADSVSDLAKKLGETGALPKLDQAREHAFYADVSGELAIARLKQRSDKEKLNRALGLWGKTITYRLPGRLQALPAKPRKADDIETEAVTSRVDLEVARRDIEVLAKEYGLTDATHFIDVFEVSGVSRLERKPVTNVNYALTNPGPMLTKTETPAVEKTPRRGFNVSLQIPIYDFGEARTRRAEEMYLRAVNLMIDKAVNVRADAREAYQAYRGAYDISRYYEKEILPLREIISAQTLLKYNGMLSDLFGLLTDARARIAANVQAIQAKRDFWLAETDLNAAITGGGGPMELNRASSAPSGDPQGH